MIPYCPSPCILATKKVPSLIYRHKVAFTSDIKNYSRFTYILFIPGILLLATVESTNLRKNSNEVKMCLFSSFLRVQQCQTLPYMAMSLSTRSSLQEGTRLKTPKTTETIRGKVGSGVF